MQTLDVLLQTTGWAATDSRMYRYRPLDGHHILAGTAVTICKNVFAQNKTNRLHQEIGLYLVRSFGFFVNPLFNIKRSH